MNDAIYKYKLAVTDLQELPLPEGAEILTAQMQYDNLCLWAAVDTNVGKMVNRQIEIIGTGHPIEAAQRDYIGTVQIHGGALVLHVFERMR